MVVVLIFAFAVALSHEEAGTVEAAVTEMKLRPLMPDILQTEGGDNHCHQPAILGYVDVKEAIYEPATFHYVDVNLDGD
ncbi:hypothetical protein MTO96_043685 [Rhipicephalus appendiculatus]